jgi:hypothetical protein
MSSDSLQAIIAIVFVVALIRARPDSGRRQYGSWASIKTASARRFGNECSTTTLISSGTSAGFPFATLRNNALIHSSKFFRGNGAGIVVVPPGSVLSSAR